MESNERKLSETGEGAREREREECKESKSVGDKMVKEGKEEGHAKQITFRWLETF